MAGNNGIPNEGSISVLVARLRDSWCVLSEIQLALSNDDAREQDRQNRFPFALGLIVEKQDELLEQLERFERGRHG